MENLEKDLEKAIAATETTKEKKVTTKKVATKKKESEEKINLNEIFSSISSISVKSQKNGIYKDSLFVGMSDKEKKHLRSKLRNTLDKFISNAFQFSKDSSKLEAIRKDWKKYATSVYKDVSIIYEGSNELKEKDVKRFLSQMESKVK